jgi:hypothetical protein
MRVHTAFALAMVDAAAKDLKNHGVKGSTWMARNVADKVDHQPTAGTVPVKAVHVHCSQRTRTRIMQEQGVDVWK